MDTSIGKGREDGVALQRQAGQGPPLSRPAARTSCVLCGMPFMGPPMWLAVGEEKLPFCQDSMGCRRRALTRLGNAIRAAG